MTAHVLDMHLMKSDLSGGISDGDRAIFVVNNLRCSCLPRRHVDLSCGAQAYRAMSPPAVFPKKLSTGHGCPHN
jgi:hypothetical protein